MNAEIALDIGGTLTLDPTEATGRPTSATLIITKPGSSTVHVASTSATLDSINTTLSVAAAVGAQTITVDSVTGIAVGRVILLRNASGQHERALVTKTATSTVVTLAEPLEYAYASADAVVSDRLTYALSAANATPEGEAYKVAWTYVIGGVTYRRNAFYDVVRSVWPTVILRADRFKVLGGRWARDILQRPGLDGRDFEDEIAEATTTLRKQILARDRRPSLFLGFDQFEKTIAFGVILERVRMGELGGKFDSELFDHWQTQYAQEFDLALAATRQYDGSDDSHIDGDEAITKVAYHEFVR